MVKDYKLEGDIDFYAELYKSLDNENENNEVINDTNKDVCLITNEKLMDKYVKLECGHTFNYVPLYKDIFNHKTKFNYMESTANRLQMDELRCPYCRFKQKGLLPYYEELELQKVYGVNSYQKEDTYFSDHSRCNYVNCTKKGNCRFRYKFYCFTHVKIVKNEYELQLKEKKELKEKKMQEKETKKKLKEEEKQKKLEEKQKKMEEKQTKMEEKQKKMEEKLLLKESKPKIKIVKKKKVENTIISEDNVILTDESTTQLEKEVCNYVLKTGVRKGEICGCNVLQDNKCKRHYQLLQKTLINK